MKSCFVPADILLPDFQYTEGEKWAVIACDQFTSQPEYWERAAEIAGGEPSTLNLILPEAYLGDEDARLPKIATSMKEYSKNILIEHKNIMIYLERTQPDGRIRRGIIGAVDLECYDWHPGTETLIRATEGTVPERIPPRVKIRKNATIELPHVILLVDDPDKNIIEYFNGQKDRMRKAYDFDLMLGGGHVSAWFIESEEGIGHVQNGLKSLSSPDASLKKYGVGNMKPLAVAVGDGNHSLATAKAVYEQLKAEVGEEKALSHPARYALAELTNIHDSALDFEPIYRVVFGADSRELVKSLKNYCSSLEGNAAPQTIKTVWDGKMQTIEIKKPEHQLTVGTLQRFLDSYIKAHQGVSADYIHGEAEAVTLASKPGVTAFIFGGMTKGELFRSVLCDGALPRKTFSMGHAEDKRYYIEARKIVL